MPPLALLEPPARTPLWRIALTSMWVYLVVAALLLLVKTLQLATGHA
jgi:hypothetical protein